VRTIILACLVLTIASVSPADARSHRRAHSGKPPEARTTQADDKTVAEKAVRRYGRSAGQADEEHLPRLLKVSQVPRQPLGRGFFSGPPL
jgi:hypothetical protein